MTKPLISICINTQNEGLRVRGTVIAFHEHFGSIPHEIIVCDDATTDGCCDNLPDTKIIRNEQRLGCGRSKRKMTLAATGEVLCFIDAHQAPFEGSLANLAKNILLSANSIVTPLCCRMEFDTTNWVPKRSGQARLAPNEEGLPPNATRQYRQWLPNMTDTHCRMVGVGVMAAKESFINLGNWCDFEGFRGSQERGLSLKAFMAGFDTSIDTNCVIGHEFAEQKNASRKGFPYPATSIQDWAKCQWHTWAVVLEQETFEQSIMPELLANPKSAYCPGHHLAKHVVEERDWFAKNAKKRIDVELLKLVDDIRNRPKVIADPGGVCMEPAALEELSRCAYGKCLEFGSGEGVSAKAILKSSAVSFLLSIDNSPKFTEKARSNISDPRALFVTLEQKDKGFYNISSLLASGSKFDFVLIDGPVGTKARSEALPAIIPLLNSGAIIFVDDGKRDKSNVDSWVGRFDVHAHMIETHRGLWRIMLK